jgi:hypothetical protein
MRDTMRLRGDQVIPSYTISDVAFGTVTVGGTGSASSTVTNTNGVGIRIGSARVTPPTSEITIDPTQFPIRIAAGGSAAIALTYMPSGVGDIPAGTKIEVTIDSICTNTLSAAITGSGIAGGVSLSPSPLDFGSLLACQTRDDTLTITNTSAIPITLSAPAIVPASAASNFSVIGGTYAPGDLAPGGSETIIVHFVPGTGSDYFRIDTLHIASSDPLHPSIDVPLMGALISVDLEWHGPWLGATMPVISVGSTASTAHWIVNMGSSVVTIDNIPLPPPFSVITTNPALPAKLFPGDSIQVITGFAPTAGELYRSTFRPVAHTVCDTNQFVFEIDGSAIDLNALARWDDATGKPGDTVHIALRLVEDVTKVGVMNVTANARFNPSMLAPLRINLDGTLLSGWSITSQSLTAGQVSFAAQGLAPIADTGVVAYLDALVALGDSTATLVRGNDTSSFGGAALRLNPQAGLFTLDGYCPVGGPRLVQFGSGTHLKAVRPNPLSSSAEIEFATMEQGRTRLALADGLGRQAALLLDADLLPGIYIVTLRGEDLPTGVYYLELRTPGGLERMKVAVVR